MTAEMARVHYNGMASTIECPCGTYGRSVLLACGPRGELLAHRRDWSGCTLGCPTCGRVLSIDGNVLVGPRDTDREAVA